MKSLKLEKTMDTYELDFSESDFIRLRRDLEIMINAKIPGEDPRMIKVILKFDPEIQIRNQILKALVTSKMANPEDDDQAFAEVEEEDAFRERQHLIAYFATKPGRDELDKLEAETYALIDEFLNDTLGLPHERKHKSVTP